MQAMQFTLISMFCLHKETVCVSQVPTQACMTWHSLSITMNPRHAFSVHAFLLVWQSRHRINTSDAMRESTGESYCPLGGCSRCRSKHAGSSRSWTQLPASGCRAWHTRMQQSSVHQAGVCIHALLLSHTLIRTTIVKLCRHVAHQEAGTGLLAGPCHGYPAFIGCLPEIQLSCGMVQSDMMGLTRFV